MYILIWKEGPPGNIDKWEKKRQNTSYSMLQIDKDNPLASHREKTSYGIPKQLITVIPSQRMRCWETRSGRNTSSFCTHFLFFKVKIKTERRPWDVEIGR